MLQIWRPDMSILQTVARAIGAIVLALLGSGLLLVSNSFR
jgi:hypothetical protein